MTGYTKDELGEWLCNVAGLLREAGVGFALIGGASVMLYGKRSRTRDVDFLVAVADDEWTRLGVRAESAGFRVERKSKWHWRIWSGAMYADLVRAGVTLELEAVRTATERDFVGVAVRVARPEHIVALKVLAGRPQDRRDVGEICDGVPDLDRDLVRELLAPFDVAWP